jgi:lipoyl(octanoyl) transferase
MTIQWKESTSPVPYLDAVSFMEDHVNSMIEGRARECVWFLEHAPVYTLGTGGKAGDILGHDDIPILETSRGGRSTYHGPGQRVVYLMLNLKERCPDVRRFVWGLEEWVIQTLQSFKIHGFRRSGRVGIWVNHPTKGEAKIAAIGLRIRKWISFHGISINVNPNLNHYQGIVPCGIGEYGVTSFKDLGIDIATEDLDSVLKETFWSVLLPCLSLQTNS